MTAIDIVSSCLINYCQCGVGDPGVELSDLVMHDTESGFDPTRSNLSKAGNVFLIPKNFCASLQSCNAILFSWLHATPLRGRTWTDDRLETQQDAIRSSRVTVPETCGLGLSDLVIHIRRTDLTRLDR